MRKLLVILLLSLPLGGQTHKVISHLDASEALSTRPFKVGTSLPGSCTVGEAFFKSNETAGQNIYGCTATDTWTLEGGGGGSSTFLGLTDTPGTFTALNYVRVNSAGDALEWRTTAEAIADLGAVGGRSNLTTTNLIPFVSSSGTLDDTTLGWDSANTLVQIGGTTSSFPALKRSGTVLQTRLADDSDFTRFDALSFGINTNGLLQFVAGETSIELTNGTSEHITFETKAAATAGDLKFETDDVLRFSITGEGGALTAAAGGATDFGSAASTNPHKVGTSLPGTCVVGQSYFKTDATAGQNVYGCTATDTWTLQGDGGGGASTFLGLSDTPGTFTALNYVRVNSAGDALEWRTPAQVLTDVAAMEIQTGTSLPGSCTAGIEQFYHTTDKLAYWCLDTDTWEEVLTTNGTGVGVLTWNEGTAPGAPPNSGEHRTYFGTDSRFHSHEYGGSEVTYLLSVETLAVDFGGATSFEIPNSAAPTVNAAGEIALDTTVTDMTSVLLVWGAEELAFIPVPVAELSSLADGDVIAYDAGNDEFVIEAQAGGGGGIDCNEVTNVCIFEEWISGHTNSYYTGTYGWQKIGTGTHAFQTAEDSAPGIMRVTTPASAHAGFAISYAGTYGVNGVDDEVWEINCRWRLESIVDVELECGFNSSVTVDAGANRASVSFDDSADTNYQFCVGTNCQDSGITPDTGWQRMTITNDGGSVIAFALYGPTGTLETGSDQTFCSAASGCDYNSITFPSGAMHPLQIVEAETATTKYADWDFFSLKMTGVSR